MSLQSEFVTRLRDSHKNKTRRVEYLERENKRLQAKIDALMLEYCPEEMTEAQLAEWGRHQVPVKESDDARETPK